MIALKGRDGKTVPAGNEEGSARRRSYFALIGLHEMGAQPPRALPWAIILRPIGAEPTAGSPSFGGANCRTASRLRGHGPMRLRRLPRRRGGFGGAAQATPGVRRRLPRRHPADAGGTAPTPRAIAADATDDLRRQVNIGGKNVIQSQGNNNVNRINGRP